MIAIFAGALMMDKFLNVWDTRLGKLEKCIKAPVAGALWYRFFEPVP